MSRTTSIRLVPLALVSAVLVLVAPSPAGAGAPALAAGCTWQRHAKPVFKHVRRHGQRRRVKRLKHWWTCEALPSTLSPEPALPVSPLTETPPVEEPELGHLGVKAVEWSYTLSRPEVNSGEVIVELNNQGEDPHNLKLQREGSEDPALEIPETPAISQASARFTLSPGTYHLYCSLYKHDAKGMQATLVVAGP